MNKNVKKIALCGGWDFLVKFQNLNRRVRFSTGGWDFSRSHPAVEILTRWLRLSTGGWENLNRRVRFDWSQPAVESFWDRALNQGCQTHRP